MSECICKMGNPHDNGIGEIVQTCEKKERVIRCRDCAFFARSAESNWLPWCWRDPDHTGHGWPTSETGFCAWAEPREES